ncbi:hypothetical protein J4446_03545 [Candidatus Woesearchaeota archaeon]|nr:hypothetical protein [Candidatus Woesearchaeota archaeon]
MVKSGRYDGSYISIDCLPKDLNEFITGLEKLVNEMECGLSVDKIHPIKAGKRKFEISQINDGTFAKIKIIYPPFGCNLIIKGMNTKSYLQFRKYVNEQQ